MTSGRASYRMGFVSEFLGHIRFKGAEGQRESPEARYEETHEQAQTGILTKLRDLIDSLGKGGVYGGSAMALSIDDQSNMMM